MPRRLGHSHASRPRTFGVVVALVASAAAALQCGCSGSRTDTAANLPEPATSEVKRGPVSLAVAVSPGTFGLADEATLTVTISRDSKLTLEPGTPEDVLRDQFVVADLDVGLPRIDGDRIVITHEYRIEPLVPGELTVPALKYQFRDEAAGETLAVETDPVMVHVTTTLDDDPKLSDLSPSDEPLDLPPDPWRHVYWVGSGLALVVVLVLLMLWKRRGPPPPPPLTPAQIARRELDALRNGGIAGTDVKEFYVRLTGVVRKYVEGTTGIRAPEQTTDEFLREVQRGDVFSLEEESRFREFLEAADLVKYAAHTPTTEDIEAALASAEAFVTWEPPVVDDVTSGEGEPVS